MLKYFPSDCIAIEPPVFAAVSIGAVDNASSTVAPFFCWQRSVTLLSDANHIHIEHIHRRNLINLYIAHSLSFWTTCKCRYKCKSLFCTSFFMCVQLVRLVMEIQFTNLLHMFCARETLSLSLNRCFKFLPCIFLCAPFSNVHIFSFAKAIQSLFFFLQPNAFTCIRTHICLWNYLVQSQHRSGYWFEGGK